MKIFVVLLSLLIAVIASPDEQLWAQFKISHNKIYNVDEEKARYSIFQNNVRIIEQHNAEYANGTTTYTMGINKFADLTEEEFKQISTYKTPNLLAKKTFRGNPNLEIPHSVDWRKTGAVGPAKDQGLCGACWSFSSTGALEGQYFIKYNETMSFSEQYLIDCSFVAGNLGCSGGYVQKAFDFVTIQGVATEDSYPYLGYQDYCREADMVDMSVTSYTVVDATEYSIANALATVGPISTFINANDLQFYKSGIYFNPDCVVAQNHAVLLVGYGTEETIAVDYWIIKNSWGTGWGEEGFFKIARNQCGVGFTNLYPNVD